MIASWVCLLIVPGVVLAQMGAGYCQPPNTTYPPFSMMFNSSGSIIYDALRGNNTIAEAFVKFNVAKAEQLAHAVDPLELDADPLEFAVEPMEHAFNEMFLQCLNKNKTLIRNYEMRFLSEEAVLNVRNAIDNASGNFTFEIRRQMGPLNFLDKIETASLELIFCGTGNASHVYVVAYGDFNVTRAPIEHIGVTVAEQGNSVRWMCYNREINTVMSLLEAFIAENYSHYHEDTAKEVPHSEGPAKEVPHSEGPAKEEPHSEAPAKEDPHSEGPAKEDPHSEGPAKEDSHSEGPAREDPHSEGAAKEDPHSEGPAKEDPHSEGPAKEDPNGYSVGIWIAIFFGAIIAFAICGGIAWCTNNIPGFPYQRLNEDEHQRQEEPQEQTEMTLRNAPAE